MTAAVLVWLWRRGEGHAALRGAAAFAAVVALVSALALAFSPSGALDAVRYHVDRPVQVESTPALTVLALDQLDAGRARSVKSFRSDGLRHPAAGALTAAFGCLLVATVATLFFVPVFFSVVHGWLGRRRGVRAYAAAAGVPLDEFENHPE